VLYFPSKERFAFGGRMLGSKVEDADQVRKQSLVGVVVGGVILRAIAEAP
jgi:hypothetical protein